MRAHGSPQSIPPDLVRRVHAALVCCLIAGGASAACADGRHLSDPPPGPISFHTPVTSGLIRAYQTLISPSRGTHCPMNPSCSTYGLQTFRSRNPLVALVMTSDRLHRCGHDLQYYDLSFVDGQPRFADAPPARHGATSEPPPAGDDAGQSAGTAAVDTLRPPPPAAPADRSAEQLLEFAESLEAYGDYPRAVTEYLRFRFYFPGNSRATRAYVGLVRAQYAQAGYEDVIRLGRQVPAGCDGESVAEIQYYVGLSLLNVNNLPRALQTFEDLNAGGIEPFAAKSAMLAAKCLAQQGRWSEARTAFAEVPEGSPFREPAFRNLVVCTEGETPDLKSPTKAAILGVVPGLGYLYAGYPKTAISAFLVTNGFIWATIEAFRRDNQGLGALLSVLSFGWYSGNIYGSVGSVDRYNDWSRKAMLAKLEMGFAF